MAEKRRNRKKSTEGYEYPVVFANDLEPALYRKCLAAVISANMQEHVSPHLRRPLLNEFVKAGLIASGPSDKD